MNTRVRIALAALVFACAFTAGVVGGAHDYVTELTGVTSAAALLGADSQELAFGGYSSPSPSSSGGGSEGGLGGNYGGSPSPSPSTGAHTSNPGGGGSTHTTSGGGSEGGAGGNYGGGSTGGGISGGDSRMQGGGGNTNSNTNTNGAQDHGCGGGGCGGTSPTPSSASSNNGTTNSTVSRDRQDTSASTQAEQQAQQTRVAAQYANDLSNYGNTAARVSGIVGGTISDLGHALSNLMGGTVPASNYDHTMSGPYDNGSTYTGAGFDQNSFQGVTPSTQPQGTAPGAYDRGSGITEAMNQVNSDYSGYAGPGYSNNTPAGLQHDIQSITGQSLPANTTVVNESFQNVTVAQPGINLSQADKDLQNSQKKYATGITGGYGMPGYNGGPVAAPKNTTEALKGTNLSQADKDLQSSQQAFKNGVVGGAGIPGYNGGPTSVVSPDRFTSNNPTDQAATGRIPSYQSVTIAKEDGTPVANVKFDVARGTYALDTSKPQPKTSFVNSFARNGDITLAFDENGQAVGLGSASAEQMKQAIAAGTQTAGNDPTTLGLGATRSLTPGATANPRGGDLSTPATETGPSITITREASSPISINGVPVTAQDKPNRNDEFGSPRPNGRIHAGNDIDAAVGSPITANVPGKVISASVVSGYGNLVQVKLADGTIERLAHLDTMSVKAGDTVKPGEKLGTVGRSGVKDSNVPTHVHVEFTKTVSAGPVYSTAKLQETRIDPSTILNGSNGQLHAQYTNPQDASKVVTNQQPAANKPAANTGNQGSSPTPVVGNSYTPGETPQSSKAPGSTPTSKSWFTSLTDNLPSADAVKQKAADLADQAKTLAVKADQNLGILKYMPAPVQNFFIHLFTGKGGAPTNNQDGENHGGSSVFPEARRATTTVSSRTSTRVDVTKLPWWQEYQAKINAIQQRKQQQSI